MFSMNRLFIAVLLMVIGAGGLAGVQRATKASPPPRPPEPYTLTLTAKTAPDKAAANGGKVWNDAQQRFAKEGIALTGMSLKHSDKSFDHKYLTSAYTFTVQKPPTQEFYLTPHWNILGFKELREEGFEIVGVEALELMRDNKRDGSPRERIAQPFAVFEVDEKDAKK